jgi:hypothetical protein
VTNLPETQNDLLADFVIYDPDNPRSITNLVSEKVSQAIQAIPRELLLMDEQKLKKHVKPSTTLNYVRLNFWLEYNRAQDTQKPMNMQVVMRGVAKMNYFYDIILQNPAMMAWVVTPPADYTLVQRDILHSGLELLQKALKMDLVTTKTTIKVNRDGTKVKNIVREPNVPAIAEVRKIVEMLSDRVQGSIIQKVAIKSQHHEIPANTLPQTYDPDALDLLHTSLGQVTARLDAAMKLEPTIETLEGELE